MEKLFRKLNRIPIACIILVIITLMYTVWGGYQEKKFARESAIFDNAVSIEDADALTPAQLKEYDGKTVCLVGSLTVRHTPSDPLTGITVPGALLLERRTEMYQYSTTGESLITGFYDFQQANVTGKGGELYENPVYPSELGAVTMLADVSVGPVALGKTFVRTLDTDYQYTDRAEYVEITPTASFDNAYGLTLRDGVYTNGNPEDPQIGDIRITYRYVDAKQYAGKMTFFGTLLDGELESVSEDDAFMIQNCDSVAQARETITGSSSDNAGGLYFMAALNAVAAVIVFVVVFIKRKKEGA
ncbi:MAG: hypothetical protein IJK98_09940 [Clostridia bacterium]|nr:hypothetical protein [Clostridia bacterium]